jgi:hypothetical protein
MARKSSVFLVILAGGLVILSLALLQAAFQTRAERGRLQSEAEFIKNFHITDLCLATEARYTRHPSQADWHSPFQSHPMISYGVFMAIVMYRTIFSNLKMSW